MTGDNETTRLMRMVFTPNYVLARPNTISTHGTALVAIDMNGLIRTFQLVSERAESMEWDEGGGGSTRLCYKWGDVLNLLHMRLKDFFMELRAQCTVLAFDSHTPPSKTPVQEKRRERDSVNKQRNERPQYRWPQSDEMRLSAWFDRDQDIEATWSEVFAHPYARLRFQEFVVRSLINEYEQPVDTCLIVEGAVLGGSVRPHPLRIVCTAANYKEVDEMLDEPPRHTYSEADIRVVHWAQWGIKNANRSLDGNAPVVVEERDADVLFGLLMLQHSLLVENPDHIRPIYMKRTRNVWKESGNRSCNVLVPEYVYINGLYEDIKVLFGALIDACKRTDYYTAPIDLFLSLVLMRGDDYCPPLAYCTAKSLWSTLFSNPSRVRPWVESQLMPIGTLNTVLTPIGLHFTATRHFVDLCYETLQLEKKQRAQDSAAKRKAAKGEPVATPSRPRSKPAATVVKKPQGYPDDKQLRCLMARQCWDIDMIVNARRPGCHAENEFRTALQSDYEVSTLSSSSSSSSSMPLSVYGFTLVGDKVGYAERVCEREVYRVERPVQPVHFSA